MATRQSGPSLAKSAVNLMNARGITLADGSTVPQPGNVGVDGQRAWHNMLYSNNLHNAYNAAIMDVIAKTEIHALRFFDDLVSENNLGQIEYGVGVREFYVDTVDPCRWDFGGDAVATLFKTYVPNIYEVNYVVNYFVQFRQTLGRLMTKTFCYTYDQVADFGQVIYDALYKSMKKYRRIMFIYNMGKGVARGETYNVSVKSNGGIMDTKDFAIKLQTMIINMTSEPTRKYNAFNVDSVADRKELTLYINASSASAYMIEQQANAFNKQYVDYNVKVKTLTSFARDEKDIQKLHDACDSIPLPLTGEMALLSKLDALLVDDRYLKVWYYEEGMFEVEKANRHGERNYFLDDSLCFGRSPYYGAIGFFSGDVDVTQPDTVTFTVDSKSYSNGQISMSLSNKVDAAQTAGGMLNFTGASADDMVALKGGMVLMASTSAGGTITAEAYEGDQVVTYTSAEVTTATNVGDEIVFTKKTS